MGPKTDKIFAQYGLDDTVLEKLNEYLLPKKNVNHGRATFHRRCQKVRENLKYVQTLYELSDYADSFDKGTQSESDLY